jgi:hypothetical protein
MKQEIAPRTQIQTEEQMSVDTNNLNEFLGRFINDLGASVHAGMVVIGTASDCRKLSPKNR